MASRSVHNGGGGDDDVVLDFAAVVLDFAAAVIAVAAVAAVVGFDSFLIPSGCFSSPFVVVFDRNDRNYEGLGRVLDDRVVVVVVVEGLLRLRICLLQELATLADLHEGVLA